VLCKDCEFYCMIGDTGICCCKTCHCVA
jgi:hypothetical protein